MDYYDVFLNHSGPGMKAGFVTHLHKALTSTGWNAFFDKKCLVKRKQAFECIDAALEVAVVSRRYAESKHCLNELAAMVGCGKPLIPVFYDVEPASLRRMEEGPFAAAFRKHRARETTQQVQDWETRGHHRILLLLG